MKKIICIATSLVVVGLIITLVVMYNLGSVYVEDYSADIGVRLGMRFEEVVELFGNPKEVLPSEHTSDISALVYDDFTLSGRHGDDALTTGRVMSVTVLTPNIRFGSRQIGIGSTRKEVRRAYNRLSLRVARWLDRSFFHDGSTLNGAIWADTDDEFAFVDGIPLITFALDENSQVRQIRISFGGP